MSSRARLLSSWWWHSSCWTRPVGGSVGDMTEGRRYFSLEDFKMWTKKKAPWGQLNNDYIQIKTTSAPLMMIKMKEHFIKSVSYGLQSINPFMHTASTDCVGTAGLNVTTIFLKNTQSCCILIFQAPLKIGQAHRAHVILGKNPHKYGKTPPPPPRNSQS